MILYSSTEGNFTVGKFKVTGFQYCTGVQDVLYSCTESNFTVGRFTVGKFTEGKFTVG